MVNFPRLLQGIRARPAAALSQQVMSRCYRPGRGYGSCRFAGYQCCALASPSKRLDNPPGIGVLTKQFGLPVDHRQTTRALALRPHRTDDETHRSNGRQRRDRIACGDVAHLL